MELLGCLLFLAPFPLGGVGGRLFIMSKSTADLLFPTFDSAKVRHKKGVHLLRSSYGSRYTPDLRVLNH